MGYLLRICFFDFNTSEDTWLSSGPWENIMIRDGKIIAGSIQKKVPTLFGELGGDKFYVLAECGSIKCEPILPSLSPTDRYDLMGIVGFVSQLPNIQQKITLTWKVKMADGKFREFSCFVIEPYEQPIEPTLVSKNTIKPRRVIIRPREEKVD